jgi:hypothetical protein
MKIHFIYLGVMSLISPARIAIALESLLNLAQNSTYSVADSDERQRGMKNIPRLSSSPSLIQATKSDMQLKGGSSLLNLFS